MPRLLHAEYFNGKNGLDPTFYFPDATYEGYVGDVRRTTYTVVSAFPVSLAIHRDRLFDDRYEAKNGPLRVSIRRFVERELAGDVFMEHREMDYRYTDRPRAIAYRPNTVQHGYGVFHFETVPDQVLFRLRFGEHISEVAARHPDFGWIDEAWIDQTWTNR